MSSSQNNAGNTEKAIILKKDNELEDQKYTGEHFKALNNPVRIIKKEFSVYELARKYKKKQLVLDVNFQHDHLWGIKLKSELIESALIGLSLPVFTFKQLKNATYVVVDGRQRLSALFDYLNNGFALEDLEILPFLNGKKFNDLTGDFGIYQSQIENYQIHSNIVLPPTSDKVLLDILNRMNRERTTY